MTVKKCLEIRRRRLAVEKCWTEHHVRDGRFSHGSWRAMTPEEAEAERLLAEQGIPPWVTQDSAAG